MSSTSGKFWACGACTFVNAVGKAAGEKCEVCETPRKEKDLLLSAEDLAMQNQILFEGGGPPTEDEDAHIMATLMELDRKEAEEKMELEKKREQMEQEL